MATNGGLPLGFFNLRLLKAELREPEFLRMMSSRSRPQARGPKSALNSQIADGTSSSNAVLAKGQRPAIAVKQSFAYGSPGKWSMPRKVDRSLQTKTTAEAIEDAVAKSKAPKRATTKAREVEDRPYVPEDVPSDQNLAGNGETAEDDTDRESVLSFRTEDVLAGKAGILKSKSSKRLATQRTRKVNFEEPAITEEEEEEEEEEVQYEESEDETPPREVSEEDSLSEEVEGPAERKDSEIEDVLYDPTDDYMSWEHFWKPLLFRLDGDLTPIIRPVAIVAAIVIFTFMIGPKFKDAFDRESSNPSTGHVSLDHFTPEAHRAITHIQYQLMTDRLNKLEYANNVIPAGTRSQLVNKVNFFARGSGVVIDPYLTSPTRRQSQGSLFARLAAWTYRLPSTMAGPANALNAWDDMGDCWCTPDSSGKSQIGMILGRSMVPKELVVEHLPLGSTLEPETAPKDIELWAQIPDPNKRERVANAALDSIPRSPSNGRSEYGIARALDESWVRVGSWQYNVYSPYNVQTFTMPLNLAQYDAPVTKVAVRVLTNWGDAKHVCLYRLKLHGKVAKTDNVTASVA